MQKNKYNFKIPEWKEPYLLSSHTPSYCGHDIFYTHKIEFFVCFILSLLYLG